MVSIRANRGVRRTMGGEGIGQINTCTLRDAGGVAADVLFRVAHELGDLQEAAVHRIGRARAEAAEVGGHRCVDVVGVVERFA
jgi:hypothetical protein